MLIKKKQKKKKKPNLTINNSKCNLKSKINFYY